jgi:hypothetical protein
MFSEDFTALGVLAVDIFIEKDWKKQFV